MTAIKPFLRRKPDSTTNTFIVLIITFVGMFTEFASMNELYFPPKKPSIT